MFHIWNDSKIIFIYKYLQVILSMVSFKIKLAFSPSL